jgi:hypothetical protein
MIEDLMCLFDRELSLLERELTLYPTDDSLWKLVPGLSNSGGNLAMHLLGNLRHFIGSQLGNTGYVRTRELEFATRSGTREALLQEVRITAQEVRDTLTRLDPRRLAEPFPIVVGPGRPLTSLFLLHLMTHLGFHLGQLDYHRRVITGESTSAEPLSPAALHPNSAP